MFILQCCKTQIMSLLLLAYVGILYIKEGNRLNTVTKKSNCCGLFSAMYIVVELAVLFDGITAFTINSPDLVPWSVNLLMHLGMFVSYEIFVTLLFWYWVYVTVGIPKKKWMKAVCILPSAVSVLLTIIFLPDLEAIPGIYTNYSMGKSVYVCFATVAIYCTLTFAVIITKYSYIPKKKRTSLYVSIIVIVIIMTIQIIFPESLVTCIAAVMSTLSIYLNMENPSIHELEHYHNEMVMGFATLVENKDDSTGGHIRRSSAYVNIIAKNLRKNPKYQNIITKDYINNINQAAPMHDIGKIGIPDAILQKPGKLTDEEYEKMKEHPVIGGKIIKDTFGHLYNGEYENMAYQVARYHHEKWNGKGYPEGLSGTDIPLCARIMAVADVFDAVSAKRCYRDAMPLEDCYNIITKGRGEDFDPDIVDTFMMNKDKIEEIYYSKNNLTKE
ncbi:MAG: HD-GYP domain-containing protein [Oscillospiraceae bacterium]